MRTLLPSPRPQPVPTLDPQNQFGGGGNWQQILPESRKGRKDPVDMVVRQEAAYRSKEASGFKSSLTN